MEILESRRGRKLCLRFLIDSFMICSVEKDRMNTICSLFFLVASYHDIIDESVIQRERDSQSRKKSIESRPSLSKCYALTSELSGLTYHIHISHKIRESESEDTTGLILLANLSLAISLYLILNGLKGSF